MHAPVSVVIPCYRCENTIHRAIESIARQTRIPLEVILVEDCSEDYGKTLSVLHDVKNKYLHLNIKIIQHEINLGPGNARNTGWNSATQPFLAFLDADDSWHPNKIELQHEWMIHNPEAILSGHESVIRNNDYIVDRLPTNWDAKRTAFRTLLFSNIFPTRSVMLRRDIPFRFLEKKRYSEDYFLWLSITSNYSAWFIPLPLAYSYKSEFSGTGLSSNLLKMEVEEIKNYFYFYENKKIKFGLFFLVSFFSVSKFIRRCFIKLWHRN